MIVTLLTEHHLEFLSLKVGCRGSPESTFVKISNCWKSHAAAHFIWCNVINNQKCNSALEKVLSILILFSILDVDQ